MGFFITQKMMNYIEEILRERSGSKCELSGTTDDLMVYNVAPDRIKSENTCALISKNCATQIDNPETTNANFWHCLNESMWNENLPVQVLAWRMLSRLKQHDWANDLLEMFYLDDDTLVWAQETGEGTEKEEKILHRDCNGTILTTGDSVVLVKDLEVKGANFTGKRGDAVHKITLVRNNPEQIEGRLNGQGIVLLTQYVKKTK